MKTVIIKLINDGGRLGENIQCNLNIPRSYRSSESNGFLYASGVGVGISKTQFLSSTYIKIRHHRFNIVLRGRWRNIILVNVHAPSEEKSEESKDSFYEELEQVFDHFPKYHTKILLGDFNAKVGREMGWACGAYG